jgi:hypothetical protein
LGENSTTRNIELTSISDHPNAIWLANLFGGRDVATREEARQVFLVCENDTMALCFAGLLGGNFEEVHRAAVLADAFAQAWMPWQGEDERPICHSFEDTVLFQQYVFSNTRLSVAMFDLASLSVGALFLEVIGSEVGCKQVGNLLKTSESSGKRLANFLSRLLPSACRRFFSSNRRKSSFAVL